MPTDNSPRQRLRDVPETRSNFGSFRLAYSPEAADGTEGRAASGEGRILFSGYASTYDQPYDVYDFLGAYKETMASGAFNRTVADSPDVVFLVNHQGLPLARTTAGNLSLESDNIGLRVDAELNAEDPDVKALIPKIERGDITEMSIAFRVTEQEWNEDYTERSITAAELDRGDVSVVTYGANPHTTASLRAALQADPQFRQQMMSALSHWTDNQNEEIDMVTERSQPAEAADTDTPADIPADTTDEELLLDPDTTGDEPAADEAADPVAEDEPADTTDDDDVDVPADVPADEPADRADTDEPAAETGETEVPADVPADDPVADPVAEDVPADTDEVEDAVEAVVDEDDGDLPVKDYELLDIEEADDAGDDPLAVATSDIQTIVDELFNAEGFGYVAQLDALQAEFDRREKSLHEWSKTLDARDRALTELSAELYRREDAFYAARGWDDAEEDEGGDESLGGDDSDSDDDGGRSWRIKKMAELTAALTSEGY